MTWEQFADISRLVAVMVFVVCVVFLWATRATP